MSYLFLAIRSAALDFFVVLDIIFGWKTLKITII